jgi:hypothetical protein
MNRNSKIIVALTVVFFIVLTLYLKNQNSIVVEPDMSVRVCFIRNTEDGGSANIAMKIIGDTVTGNFDLKPAEKDQKMGMFEGTISSTDTIGTRIASVWWDASSEGVQMTEELKIKINDSIAAPGFGAMKDRGDGTLVYASPESIVYEPNLSLVDCEIESM